MKKKGMARGGMKMKKKGMARGGAKMPMAKDPKTGKMIPAFAMDGKGKMAKGGMSKKKTYWEKVDFEINYNLYLNPNENNNLEPEDYEFENKFKVSWKLTEKIRVYNIGEIARLKGNDYYKAKIGVEVSL